MKERCTSLWAPSSEDSIFIRKKVSPFVREVDLLLITIFDYFNVCFMLLMFETLQWVGCWNMLTIWLWPWPNTAVERDVVYVLVGVILRFISKRWLNERYDVKKDWDPDPPINFQWKRKVKRFASGFLNFLAFLFGWVGLWDLFDVQFVERSFSRDLVFFFGTTCTCINASNISV